MAKLSHAIRRGLFGGRALGGGRRHGRSFHEPGGDAAVDVDEGLEFFRLGFDDPETTLSATESTEAFAEWGWGTCMHT